MGEDPDRELTERHRGLEARVVMLEGDVRAMETRHTGIAEDVRWLRDRQERVEERSARRWDQVLGCLQGTASGVLEIAGSLLGSNLIRGAILAATIALVPGALTAYRVVAGLGEGVTATVTGTATTPAHPEPSEPEPAPKPANAAADTDDAEPLPPLGGL